VKKDDTRTTSRDGSRCEPCSRFSQRVVLVVWPFQHGGFDGGTQKACSGRGNSTQKKMGELNSKKNGGTQNFLEGELKLFNHTTKKAKTMLVLFETASGYSLFNLKKASALDDADLLAESFAQNPSKVVSLVAFEKFTNVPDATAAATALVEGKLDKGLSKFLKAHMGAADSLLVSDSKLGAAIKQKLAIECVAPSASGLDGRAELLRGVRANLSNLVPGLEEANARQMALGLAHQLSRYKLRFSPDKVDTMIVQAIGLLDELDKEINTYAMRVREWYGWHFPEMAKIVLDGVQYAKIAQRAGLRINMRDLDFSDILEDEEVERQLKETAIVRLVCVCVCVLRMEK